MLIESVPQSTVLAKLPLTGGVGRLAPGLARNLMAAKGKLLKKAAPAPKKEAPVTLESFIAEELSKARQRAQLSQREVAARAGLTQAAISRLESGDRLPRLETLLALAEATDHVLELRLKRPRQGSAGGALRRG
jgi:DNA-binding XRE family transcriptional regulator